jgi:hypothetical protein
MRQLIHSHSTNVSKCLFKENIHVFHKSGSTYRIVVYIYEGKFQNPLSGLLASFVADLKGKAVATSVQ